jgi:hypothetical protein
MTTPKQTPVMTIIPTEKELYMQAISEIDMTSLDTYLDGLQKINGMDNDEKYALRICIEAFIEKRNK